jgi:hypothetical protein
MQKKNVGLVKKLKKKHFFALKKPKTTLYGKLENETPFEELFQAFSMDKNSYFPTQSQTGSK